MTTLTSTDPVQAITLTDGEIAFYQREGWLQVPQLLTPEATAALRDDVLSIMAQIGGWQAVKLRQTSEYLADSPIDRHVHSSNLAALAATLSGGTPCLWLPFTAVKGQQGGRFHFHQDNNYTRLDGPALNIWVALVDMGPELGTLQVVPQSHHRGTRPAERLADGHRAIEIAESDFIPMRLRAGDAVVFSRDTVHGSGANTGDGPRVAYAVQYGHADARYPDPETGEPVRLGDRAKFAHTHHPVDEISIPTERLDGH